MREREKQIPRIFAGVSMLLLLVLYCWHFLDVLEGAAASGDGFLTGGYIALGLLLLVLCGASFYLAFVRAVRLPFVFAVSALLLGFAWIFVFRGLSAPDEISHYISAYKLSNVILGKEAADEHGRVYVRSCDMYLEDTEGRIDEVYAANEAGIASGIELKIFGQTLDEDVYRVYAQYGLTGFPDSTRNTGNAAGGTTAGETSAGEKKAGETSAGEKIAGEISAGEAAGGAAGSQTVTAEASAADKNSTALSCQWTVNTMPLAYLPQSIGISIARLLGFGPLGLITAGKLGNLLFFVCVTFAALCLMPAGAEIVCGTALLPMTMHLAGSMSYDVYVICMSFLFTALMLRISQKETFGLREILPAAVVLALLGPCKMVYSLLLLLVLLVVAAWKRPDAPATTEKNAQDELAVTDISVQDEPAVTDFSAQVKPAILEISAQDEPAVSEKIPQKDMQAAKSKNPGRADGGRMRSFVLLCVTCLVLLGISMYLVNHATISDYASADERVITWAEEPEGYTFTYLIHRPVETVRIMYGSFLTVSGRWFSTMFGVYLGNMDPVYNVPYPVIGIFALGLLVIAAGSGLRLNIPGKAVCALTFLLVLGALMGSMLLAYTPVSSPYIEGVQGRYLLPVLPLLLFCVPGEWISLKRSLARETLWLFVVLNAYVLVRVYATVCLRL